MNLFVRQHRLKESSGKRTSPCSHRPYRPIPKTLLNKYHIEDARNVGTLLPEEEFVSVTITSPPYWNLKDYGTKRQIGFGQGYEEYLNDLQRIFGAVHRITKKTGSLWVIADTIKHNGELKLFPFDLARRLETVGWLLHDIIVWHKDKTLPWSHRGKLRNIFEYVLFFSKGKRFKYYLSRVRETGGLKEWWVRYPERYSPLGKAPTRTWSIPIPRQGSWGKNWVQHFCPFPPELVRRVVLLTTRQGDVVLDPFAGSGVVLAQAKVLGRSYVGLDLRKSYRRMFETKVLPSLIRLEARNSKARLHEGRNKKAFSSLVWRLRRTKYPRELIRLYEKNHGKLGILGTLALSPAPKTLDLTLVLSDSKRSPRNLLPRMKKIMRRPPLSKYGLKVSVSAVSADTFAARKPAVDGVRPGTKLCLYEKGRTHHYTREISVTEFLESLKDTKGQIIAGTRPIASNVRVRATREMLD